MTITVYRNTDSGAPTLDRTAGSLAALLKACLVTGYGNKAGAGWTCPIDNGNTKLFRNNSTTGSGHYFRVKDDGYSYVGQLSADYSQATITGAVNYTDIDTLIQPFPRTITGSDLHSTTYYGQALVKPDTQYPAWAIIADEKTCYYFYSFIGIDIGAPRSWSAAFGDFKLLADIASHPKAFVSGNGFNTTGNLVFSAYRSPFKPMEAGGNYMPKPLTGGSQSTGFYVIPPIMTGGPGALAYSATWGYFHLYPSPITGGFVIEPIYVADDTANVVRTYQHSNPQVEQFATLPGVYWCAHTLANNTNLTPTPIKFGDVFDEVVVDGKTYLVLATRTAYDGNTLVVDITGDW